MRPRQVERVRITAAHHPLAGRLVAVVRRKRYRGEPHLIIERPDGGRQLLPARDTAAADPIAAPSAPPLPFTPGGLRALVGLIHTLRGEPPPAPEVRHGSRPQPARPTAPAAVEHLPARDAPAPGRALGRSAAPAASGRPAAAAARPAGRVP